eukprot:scaffold3008_cov1771-Pavlova_lutheri.AAC.6
MLSHGLVSPALFLCVGALYERHRTRLVKYYGGCFAGHQQLRRGVPHSGGDLADPSGDGHPGRPGHGAGCGLLPVALQPRGLRAHEARVPARALRPAPPRGGHASALLGCGAVDGPGTPGLLGHGAGLPVPFGASLRAGGTRLLSHFPRRRARSPGRGACARKGRGSHDFPAGLRLGSLGPPAGGLPRRCPDRAVELRRSLQHLARPRVSPVGTPHPGPHPVERRLDGRLGGPCPCDPRAPLRPGVPGGCSHHLGEASVVGRHPGGGLAVGPRFGATAPRCLRVRPIDASGGVGHAVHGEQRGPAHALSESGTARTVPLRVGRPPTHLPLRGRGGAQVLPARGLLLRCLSAGLFPALRHDGHHPVARAGHPGLWRGPGGGLPGPAAGRPLPLRGAAL